MIVRNQAVMGGEAVLKGTRIPVRLIAAMLDDGATDAEVLAGYPTLTARDLALAPIWVAANPSCDHPKTRQDGGLVLKQSRRIPLG